MVYKFFDRKSADSGATPNQQLTDEAHKSIARKCKRDRVYFFLMKIFGVLIFLRFLLSVINNTWVAPSKDKKSVTIVDTFRNILNNFERKTKKV